MWLAAHGQMPGRRAFMIYFRLAVEENATIVHCESFDQIRLIGRTIQVNRDTLTNFLSI
jgi:hypothetical protein